jgi:hypothetical protein
MPAQITRGSWSFGESRRTHSRTTDDLMGLPECDDAVRCPQKGGHREASGLATVFETNYKAPPQE